MVNSAEIFERFITRSSMVHKQSLLRQRFNKVIVREPRSLREISRLTGLSLLTVRSFIMENRQHGIRVLSVIERWLEEEEKRLGIT
jgi:hypothetical protein